MYRAIILEFIKNKPTILNDILAIINESERDDDTPTVLMKHVEGYLESKQYEKSFLKFTDDHSMHDDTWEILGKICA